jgi:serine/threonine protein kinase
MDIKSSAELSPFVLNHVTRTGVTLGVGSFGSVEEVSMNGASCAGKKLHDVLLRAQSQNRRFLVKKLVEECKIMSELKHPNIVQFFGLTFFDDSAYPMIVMEKLDSNLDTFLTSFSSIPLVLKSMLMQDIVQGLNYLHTQIPPIIHRDITARNVLLTSSMTAKLGDLGSARIIQSHGISSTLSRTPGTLVYMPPEANQPTPKYDSSLDMFSFGHLILFIVLQEFPSNLHSYTYPDPTNPGRVLARTELDRRKNYVDQCVAKLGSKSTIVHVMCSCLSDTPQKRLTAAQALGLLTENKGAEEKMRREFHEKVKFQGSLEREGSTEGIEDSSNYISQQMLRQVKVSSPIKAEPYMAHQYPLEWTPQMALVQ